MGDVEKEAAGVLRSLLAELPALGSVPDDRLRAALAAAARSLSHGGSVEQATDAARRQLDLP